MRRSSRPRRRRFSGGFTLIEVLVVFVLVALLLTIAVPRFLRTADTAKDRVRAQNIATLRDAIDKFKADQGRYPAALGELVQKQYLRRLPHDPVTQSDQWVAVPAPGAAEPGIYDVAPPNAGPSSEPAPPPPVDVSTTP